jgi:2-amino-4-hydroxy-6-hydroxymethyldihydropteridine diphosphokinase
MAIVFLGLGSNLGDRVGYLREARDAIRKEVGEIIAESSIYENESIGFSGNVFCNQVLKIETSFLPEIVLQKTQAIEKKLGRVQKTNFEKDMPIYHNRIMDIDILLYDDLQIDTKALTIPHPRMYEREFVMKLLREIKD